MINTHTVLSPWKARELFDAYGAMFNKPQHLMELAARSCYDSINKMGKNPHFMRKIIEQGHLDILEHGFLSATFTIDNSKSNLSDDRYYFYYIFKEKFPYAQIKVHQNEIVISANMRVWWEIQNDNYSDLDGFVSAFELSYLKHYLHFLAPDVFVEAHDLVRGDILDNMMLATFKSVASRTFFPSPEVTAFGNQVGLLAFAPDMHYTFEYIDVSRALMAQHTRHRRFVYSVKSSRYCDARNSTYVHNPFETEPGMRDIIDSHFQVTMQLYENLRGRGMKKEDARGITACNMATNIITSGDISGWNHYFNERIAPDAQEEIRQCASIARDMYEATKVQANNS